jgi:hypothetical protein
MATSKTAKIETEIEKTKAKIGEYQAKLRELEGKRTAIENTEIVDIVRGLSIPLDELAALLQSGGKGGALFPTLTSGQVGQKFEAANPVDPDETEETAE